jgi:hypothetical protein
MTRIELFRDLPEFLVMPVQWLSDGVLFNHPHIPDRDYRREAVGGWKRAVRVARGRHSRLRLTQ